MRNRHKPLHDIEKWSIDGSEKKGHKAMNEALHGLVPPALGSEEERKREARDDEDKLVDRLDRVMKRGRYAR
jgi:hypothetical protein